MTRPGQDPGQPSWGELVDAWVHEHGSLAAVAGRLAALGGWRDDAESIARALRRLRGRGTQPGGRWGERALQVFGLPRTTEARLRFMGTYHSRFVDLPSSLALDLVSLWDRPPVHESRAGRAWLSLARVVLAFRAREPRAAREHLDVAARAGAEDPAVDVEIALGSALLASDARPDVVPVELEPVPPLSRRLARGEAECVRARWAGQVAHALHRAGDHGSAEAVLRALPDDPDTHPFARSRRANGLAYARLRAGDHEAARRYAELAARHAGDAGHVRLRAMALLMSSRLMAGDERAEVLARARAIAIAIEDEVLLARCDVAAG